jgi:Na+-translocating ferredoxin:NAD+ oxidoreductase subunit B
MDRKKFINNSGRLVLLAGLGYLTGSIFLQRKVSAAGKYVWQIDPFKCTQCGRCATSCVRDLSAVKCVHAYSLCGYCDLCGGYFKPNTHNLNTGAESQLCPTGALNRKFVEEPFFEYTIDEKLCNACGKCVKGCGSFGNGSLHLQIRHDLCQNCNECSIARVCPSDAISRVPIETAYQIKGDFKLPDISKPK